MYFRCIYIYINDISYSNIKSDILYSMRNKVLDYIKTVEILLEFVVFSTANVIFHINSTYLHHHICFSCS